MLRLEALRAALARATDEGIPTVELKQLQELVLGDMVELVGWGMTSNPLLAVEPMRVGWKPGTPATKAEPRVYKPGKYTCGCQRRLLCMLEKVGLVYSNPQVVFEYRHGGAEREDTYWLVADCQGFNQQLDTVPWPPSSLEQTVTVFEGSNYFVVLDMLQALRRMPIDAKGKETLTVGTEEGLFHPRPVLMDFLNATPYSLIGTDKEVLTGLARMICKVGLSRRSGPR